MCPQDDGSTPESETRKPSLTINAQYIKDLSFEAPSSPEVLAEMQKQPPEINVNVNVNARKVEEPVYEVVLLITAKCKVGEKVAFIIELEYGGMFSLNVPTENVQPVLLIECPRLLFPFARNILADVSRDGGFPPLMLSPVDFVAMYQNQMNPARQAGGDSQSQTE